MFNLPSDKGSPYNVLVERDRCSVAMEIDTSTALSEVAFIELWADRSVDPSTVKLFLPEVGTVKVTLS